MREARLVDRPVVVPISESRIIMSGLDMVIEELSVYDETLFALPNKDSLDQIEMFTGHTTNREIGGKLSPDHFLSDDEMLVELTSRLTEGRVGLAAEKMSNREYLMENTLPTAHEHSHVVLFVSRISAVTLSRLSQMVTGCSWDGHLGSHVHAGLFIYPAELSEWPNQVLFFKDRMSRAYSDYLEMVAELKAQFRREHPDAVMHSGIMRSIRRIAGYTLPTAAAHWTVISGSVKQMVDVCSAMADSSSEEEQRLADAMKKVVFPLAPNLFAAYVEPEKS